MYSSGVGGWCAGQAPHFDVVCARAAQCCRQLRRGSPRGKHVIDDGHPQIVIASDGCKGALEVAAALNRADAGLR